MITNRVPFTPVDELACWLDGPSEPNNVHLEAVVEGHLDPARLHAAVLDALDAHPLARARRLAPRPWHWRAIWEIADHPDVSPVEEVRWTTATDLARQRHRLLADAPPLGLAPPLRVRHAAGPDSDVILLSAHHALLDGLSCLRLLRSIACRYAGRPDPAPTNPLAVREPPLVGGERLHAPKGRLRPAARIAADRAHPLPGYGFERLTLPCLPRTGHGTGAPVGTVNDIMIVALAAAIAAWNAAHGADTGDLRITMPINARPPGPEGEPLGNLSRLASIGIDHDARHSPRRLLSSVAAQTAQAKHAAGPQLDPLTRALALPWCPTAMRARLVRLAHRIGAHRFSDTSLVSNLGAVREPLDFGPGAPVGKLWFSTPAPMPRGLSLGAITLRNELHLCFRYRRALFDEAAAVWFVEMFRRAVATIDDPRLIGEAAA